MPVQLFFFSSLACLLLLPAQAETVHIIAERDATLIEDSNGALANGAGPTLFVGRTSQSSFARRRAVIRFDVAAHLPARAKIHRVFLSLYHTSGNETPHSIRLHRLLQNWREGQAFSAGGSGAPAGPGDATWLHTDYDVGYWRRVGGHFVAHPSAATTVAGEGYYTWQSSPWLVNDVRRWLRAPQRNFGWLIAGDELTPRSAKRFASREAPDSGLQPMLTIEYDLVQR